MTLAAFNSLHPYHRSLDLIASRQKTAIGNGRFEIPAAKARQLQGAKLALIVEGRGCQLIELTDKGKASLRDSKQTWLDHVV